MEKDLKLTVLGALRWLLRPVVRMMLKHGVMHREFAELSKSVYVEVARKEYGLRGRPTNISRTALLTGLDRKEVTRIKQSLEADDATADFVARQDRISRVLAGWHQDDDYVDSDSNPLPLAEEGQAPSFEDLVKRYGGDVPAITILRELKRIKAVSMTHKGLIKAMRRNYRPTSADPDAINRTASVLADIGDTVTHNLYHEPKQLTRFERRASNPRIPKSAVPAYRDFVYSESQAFLERVDAWLTEHEVPETDPQHEKALRLGLGMYWIQTDAAEGGRS